MTRQRKYDALQIAQAFGLQLEDVLKTLHQYDHQLPLPVKHRRRPGRPRKDGAPPTLSPAGKAEQIRVEMRLRVIRRLRARGLTLQEIADRYGLTRERIRQILAKSGPPIQIEPCDPELVGSTRASEILHVATYKFQRLVDQGQVKVACTKGGRHLFRLSDLRGFAQESRSCRICGAPILNPRARCYCSADCRNEAHSYRYWSDDKKQRHREAIEQWQAQHPEKYRQIQARASKTYQRRTRRRQQLAKMAKRMSELT